MQTTFDNIEIRNWDNQLAEQATKLLIDHAETSLFLLANLQSYGPRLTEKDSYSGDFKCLVKNGMLLQSFA